jgi:hypothetical protein
MHAGSQSQPAALSREFRPFAIIPTYAGGRRFVQFWPLLSVSGHPSRVDTNGTLQVKERGARGTAPWLTLTKE